MSTLAIHPDLSTSVSLDMPDLTTGAIDISADRRPSLGRLISVEFRKMIDTRSGRTLFAATAAIPALVNAIMLIFVATNKLDPLSFAGFVVVGSLVGLAFLLPAIVILSVTGEWNHRAALNTFTLVPERGRVLLAKFAAAIGVTITTFAVVVGISALATFVSAVVADVPAMWDLDFRLLGRVVLPLVYLVVMAFGFAVFALNSAGGLVGFSLANLALPTMFSTISQFTRFGESLTWINPAAYRAVMLEPSVGANWAHLAVSALIWVGIPMVIGVRRVLTSEIK